MALEITSRLDLVDWFEDQSSGWAVLISLRAVLRAGPLAFDPNGWNDESSGSLASLTVFRALSASQARLEYPTDEGVRAANLAGVTADNTAFWSDTNDTLSRSVIYTLDACSQLAFAAASEGNALTVHASDAVFDAAVAANGDIPDTQSPADNVWQSVLGDCDSVKMGAALKNLKAKPLWNERPDWFIDTWSNASKWLSSAGLGFEIWREWYYGRLEGLPHAFANFDDAADEKFYSWLVKHGSAWWKREPAEVNAEIKTFVDSLRKPNVPSDEELEQNPRAFTFSLDSEGRTELDEDVLPNGLQGDADERDNHSEILRLIENAVLATAGDTNAKDMAEPTDLLKEAVGETVEALRPRLFVLRAREIIRQVNERESGESMNPQLSEKQRDAYLPLVAALAMIAEFSPKLAQLWHGKLGQTGEPLTREMLDLIAEAFRNSRQTTDLAQAIIEASNAQVAPDAPDDDPARIAASETSRNVVRKMGGAVKKAGDGARSIENIAKLTDRAIQIAGYLKGRLPDGETIARILQMFGGG
ncbi:hypothetical protein [Erythrobacter sp. F6033]|uniref:hypothetical protein n=1 Tax=Erythrobacter sp. F6033 TaxID=2926401 RepID=UPI001FF2995F|nr:hypothetical protein [Erythrobacter sp. F6033]MCK0128049.1 hypothetical protein [Erythrobacter sp. F6033]